MTQLVIVISGPGGVGKGTVVSELVRNDDRLALSRSWTTRQPRPGEHPDAYVFVDDEQFLAAIQAGMFLEWNHFLGSNYYGSPVPDVDDGRDLVLEIDVNGARQILDVEPNATLVFIDAPSVDHQRERLIGRGDRAEQVANRMAAGASERKLAKALPYTYVTNDDVARAAAEIAALIADRRSQVDGAAPDPC